MTDDLLDFIVSMESKMDACMVPGRLEAKNVDLHRMFPRWGTKQIEGWLSHLHGTGYIRKGCDFYYSPKIAAKIVGRALLCAEKEQAA